MTPGYHATATPTPDDIATALPSGYRQALLWRAHLPPRQPMVCTPSPLSLSRSIYYYCISRCSKTHVFVQKQVDSLDLCLEIML